MQYRLHPVQTFGMSLLCWTLCWDDLILRSFLKSPLYRQEQHTDCKIRELSKISSWWKAKSKIKFRGICPVPLGHLFLHLLPLETLQRGLVSLSLSFSSLEVTQQAEERVDGMDIAYNLLNPSPWLQNSPV